MSQWASLVTQPNRALELYRDKEFPLDVRHHLSHYIESRSWMSIPPHCAASEFSALINTLDKKIIELRDTGQLELVLASHKLTQCRTQLINLYSNTPNNMVQNLNVLMQMEHKLLTTEFQLQHQRLQPGTPMTTMTPVTMATMTSDSPGTPMIQTPTTLPTISNTLNNLDSWGQNANIIYQYIGNTKDALNKTSPNKRGPIQTKMKRLQGNLEKHLHTIHQARDYLISSIQSHLEQLTHQNKVILQNISDWKRIQRKAMVGYPESVQIDELGVKVTSHAAELETCLQQIRLAVRHFNNTKHAGSGTEHGGYMSINSMREQIVLLIRELVSKSLVIEELPTAVLKKDTKFAATLRLLVGGHFGISRNLPEVSSALVDASQIQAILCGNVDVKRNSCGDILNGCNLMEHFESANSVKLYLRKLMLKKYTRTSSSDKVGEERYGLCFTSKLTLHLQDKDEEIQLVCISPSLALIVHTRQIALAEGSVIWENAFSDDLRDKTPVEVPWCELTKVLNYWFQLNTGRGLSDDNMHCLRRKLAKSDHVTDKDMISWKRFAKEPLADRNFTFWDWLYSAYDLIDKCLKDLWNDGLLMGFVSKEEVQQLLSQCEPNTFILRFSDSQLGAVSASWLHKTDNRPGEILHLEPNTHKGLAYISLAERIIGLPDLKTLYPNHPKNQVFGKYIQKRDLGTSDTAYVRQNISVTVDLPQRHHSAPLNSVDSATLNSPLHSFDDDLPVFDGLDCPDFSMSPTSAHEMVESYSSATDNNFYTVNEIEPSLADLDLDSLLSTAQNNLDSLSSEKHNSEFNSDPQPGDLQQFFGGFQ